MKSKTLQLIAVIGFCGFLALMSVLYLLLPKMDFS